MTEQTNPAAALMAAMAKAQGEFKPIEKNRTVRMTTKAGGTIQFRYADLDEILSKTRPALSANGLALIQTVEHGQNGAMLTCKLMHSGGGIVTSETLLPVGANMGDPKAFGAAITYFRRYMVTAMLGVAADDDLDEDGQEMASAPAPTAGKKPPVAQPQRRAEAPAQPAAGDTTACTQGELAYIGKKIEGKGWTMAQAYEAAGIGYDETANNRPMTKAEFAAIKAVVA